MNAEKWKDWVSETVREVMAAPEFDRYFAVKPNRPRAAMMLTQHGRFSRHRRNPVSIRQGLRQKTPGAW